MRVTKSPGLFSSLLLLLTVTLLWSFLHAFGLYWSGLSWQFAIIDSAISNLLNVFVVFILFNALRFYQPTPKKLFYVFIWNIILAKAVTIIFSYLFEHLFTEIFIQEKALINSTLIFRVAYETFLLTSFSLFMYLWSNFKSQQESLMRKSALEKISKEAELYNLRQQLQPHFLFNSLNSISALAGSQPELARKMIQQLSDFLRGTLKNDEQQFATMTDELEQLRLYLEIEKVRFGHRMNTEIYCEYECLQMKLPSFILQPIVENAIKFGLYGSLGEVFIRIKILCKENYLHIQVQNPFDFLVAKTQKGTGFGLNSVQRRLFLLFSRNDLLKCEADEKEFTATIKIPQL